MLAAVQIYNNPQITFKTETFITLVIIAWTYLMHAYYRKENIDYLYYEIKVKRKYYNKTKNGAKNIGNLKSVSTVKIVRLVHLLKTTFVF